MKSYKEIVKEIRNLGWNKLSSHELEMLMILSYYAALEFAESLRITLGLYPESLEFQEMAAGELKTSNLQWDDYNVAEDHAEFLKYFIGKYGLTDRYPEATRAGEEYLAQIRTLAPEVRAMSITSREFELPGIFERILEAKNWSTPALQAFRYYLEEHIKLDSGEHGHADLLSGFTVTEEAGRFWEARLGLYPSIKTLFA